MKAIIELDVPEWQIGQEVSIYFPDTMSVKGICKKCEPYIHHYNEPKPTCIIDRITGERVYYEGNCDIRTAMNCCGDKH